ncbi:MAG: alpha-ketoacid dehydrogenase subunit beta [Rhodospirillales bacterium]|nr:alpha-ketoacid dehydrogenase subunit beta [Rhodospirillales bacterium]
MSLPENSQRVLSYVDALRESAELEMSNDENVFVFGLDVDDHKAIQGSTSGLVEKFGPERVFTTPLSEDAMTGVAIGAAMAGMRPIHVHIRMDFLMLCMNQLINIAAKSSYMYGGSVKVPMVVRSMIGKSWGQGAQHSQALYSMFMHVPGLKVIAPSNAYDAKGALAAAIQDDNPVIFVEHRLLYPTEAYVPEERYTIELGRARVVRSGADVTLVGISNMVLECLRAAELLEDAGISAEVIDPITLAPLDTDTIVQSVQKTKYLLIVDNAWTACGASAEILSRVVETMGTNAGADMRRMGFAPTSCPTTPALEDHFYPNPVTISKRIFEMLRGTAKHWEPDSKKAELAYQKQFKGPF